MIGIVVSRADSASVHVGEHLLDLADWEAIDGDAYRTDGFVLREFDDLHLDLDRVADAFADPDCVVFASRHSGNSGKLLSAHYTGNFGEASHGGADRDLSTPCPGAHRQVLRALARNAPEGWDVAMECTHHGPTTIGAPAMFVELGSEEAQWEDPAGARAVAESILALDETPPDPDRTVVGFGGNHYAPRPTRLIQETDVAVGHVAADWSLEELGKPATHPDVVAAMFEESDADLAVFEGDRPAVEEVVTDLGYRVVSETWLRETQGRSRDLIETVEEALGTVGEGVRLGTVEAAPADVVVREVPADLLAAAQGIDREATVECVAASSVAYRTLENGNRVDDAAAFASPDGYEEMIDGLAEVLREDYDNVTRVDGAIVAEREVFDPERAHEAGVPEGPKFGALAAGERVEVDGETIDPERVRRRETSRFPV
ncbi:MAG: D-aminoacyl-tRNA deacylase [Halanaeroarchaeum sp.]